MLNRSCTRCGDKRSRFDTCMPNLVRTGAAGTPAADEARGDYAATVTATSIWPGFEVGGLAAERANPLPGKSHRIQ